MELLNTSIKKYEDEVHSFFEDYLSLSEHQKNSNKHLFSRHNPLVYSSCDIRYSGFKISPVDTNLFPAGFNLLSSNQRAKAAKEARFFLTRYLNFAANIDSKKSKKNYEAPLKIFIFIERHDRNKSYFANISAILDMFSQAGYETYLVRDDIPEALTIQLDDTTKQQLKIYPLTKQDNRLFANNTEADIIIVNNDMTSGAPDILQNLDSQEVFPPVGMGWYRRKKSCHFAAYNKISQEFSDITNIDNWLINPYFDSFDGVNFKEKQGLDTIAEKSSTILSKIAEKYKQYSITATPRVFIKSNKGTYGMGITSISDPQEILDINKKTRHSLNNVKEQSENDSVIIQESIPTIETIDNNPAESLIYSVAGKPIACLYRVNSEKNSDANLNSRGMWFHNNDSIANAGENLCSIKQSIAKLANIAALKEIDYPNHTL